MRQAYNGQIWKDDSGKVIGVNLGADYCAEHEWGIKGITSAFQINSDLLGINKRTITSGFENIVQIETSVSEWSTGNKPKKSSVKLFGLALKSRWSDREDFSYYSKNTTWDSSKDEIKGFWSESRFLFFVKDASLIDEFVEAFKKNDIAIWLGSGQVFQNGGLCIIIPSRLSEEFKQQMLDDDLDRIALKKAAEATKIEDKLNKAGKKFYSLSPRWKNQEKKEVVFWLNPAEQHIYDYGSYSVDDLEKWIKDEGPIIKKASN